MVQLRHLSASGISHQLTQNKHVAIAFALGVLILFGLAPEHGLTQQGVVLLAIVAPTMYMWLFVNTHWVSLLFLALLSLSGIMTPNQVWAGSLGHFSIMLVLVFSLISQCLSDTGVIEKLAHWFISRPWVQGRPYGFLAMYMLANLFLGIFMQNLALAVMFVGLTAKICEQLEITPSHSLYKCLMLGTFWGNGVLSIASPIAKTLPNILIGLVYAHLGVQISYAQWLMIGLPFMAVSFGVIMLCIWFAKPDTTPLKNHRIEADTTPLGLRGKVAVGVTVALLAVILIPELFLALGVMVGLSQFLVSQGVIVPGIVALVALSLLSVKEGDTWQPVMDFAQVSTKVPINLLLFVSAVVIMGVPLSSEATGVLSWLQHLLLPLTESLSPWTLFATLVVLAIALTNLLSNTVVLTVFMSLGLAVFAQSAINPAVFGVVMAFGSSMATLTPSATITAPLYYGPGHLDVRRVVGLNLLFLVLITGVLLAFIPWVQWVIQSL